MAFGDLGDLLMSFGYIFDATGNPSVDFGEGLWRSGEPAGIHLGAFRMLFGDPGTFFFV